MMGEGPRQQTEKASQVSVVAIPVLFVLLWASGFVVPRVFGPMLSRLRLSVPAMVVRHSCSCWSLSRCAVHGHSSAASSWA
jgi:hypothetical protein